MHETSTQAESVSDDLTMPLRIDVFTACTSQAATDAERAALAGISRSTLIRLKAGSEPSAKTMKKMAQKLAVPMARLWRLDGAIR